MADRSWEEVEEGFTAVRWTLEALHHRLESLEEDGMSDHGEFGMAAKKTADILRQLQDAINETGRLRQGHPPEPEPSPKTVEYFHKYVQVVHERMTWEETLEHVAGEIPAGRVLLREVEPVAARAVQEMNCDAYAFLHFNPQLDLSKHHGLLEEVRQAESFFPFASNGKMVLQVRWRGIDPFCSSGFQPGEIRLTGDGIVAVRRFRHFFDMIFCLEQLPSIITPSALSKSGFEVQRSRGLSNAPEGPVDSVGTLSRSSS